MANREGNDVHTVLSYLLHDPQVSRDRAVDAAARLSAGPTGETVRAQLEAASR
jgi:hypothetical protein